MGKIRKRTCSLEEKIGEGSFAQVYLGKNEKGETVVVEKVEKFPSREVDANSILHHHKNIAKFQDVYEDGDGTFDLIFEYVEGQNLFDLMASRNSVPLSEEAAFAIFSQLVNALLYCHKKGVYHRDIKLENIMITPKGRVKLIDFGLAGIDSQGVFSDSVGSLHYSSPEVLLGIPDYSGEAADVYSLGVVLFSLLFGSLPFDAKDRIGFFSNERPHHPDLIFPELSKVSNEAKDLITRMLIFTPCDRILLKEVSIHEWACQKNSLIQRIKLSLEI